MKRQLSLVLALVMILGTFTTVFAADTSADAITESSTFLKDKGVLVGNMSGDLMLGEKLSRQDTAVLVARLMGELKIAQEFPTAENIPTYEDVKDDFYLPILAWAQANKTFVGHSDARFGFDDDVTAQEYSKVLLVALGYNVGPNGDNDLTWEATLAKAKDLGILDNINDDVKNTDEITRGEMAVMTFNALSVMMKDGTQTLAEKLGIVMPAATKLTATVKDTKNLKEVVVELSNAKLADADRLADASNYKIKGVSVDEVEVVGNDVIVKVEKTLVKDRNYELTIRNIESGVNGTYNFKALDNTIPAVEEVTVLGEYGIKVTLTEPIRDAKERNFLVDGRNVSMNVETYGRDLILTPYYNEAFSDDAKTLTIKELEDFAGYKSVEQKFDIKIVKDDVAPKVTDVVLKGNKVEVTFDKDVYAKSVKSYDGRSSVGNISYQSGRQTVYATNAKKIDTNKVEYTFESEMPRRTDVTIEGVQNHSKVAMARVTESPRIVQDYTEPEIIEKDVTTTDTTATIELKFNKAVEGDFIDEAKTKFDVSKHFTLYEREAYRGREVKTATMTAEYKDAKKDVVVVKISGLEKYTSANDLNYVLEVENFVDVTSSRNIMYRDYVDFKVSAKTDFQVDDVLVYQDRNQAEITVKFSKSLDKVQAEEFANYLFESNSGKVSDVRDLKGSVYLESNGKVVTIILPEDQFRVKDFKTLTILNSIKDLDGNRFAKSAVYYFNDDVLLRPDQKLEDVLAAREVDTLISELPLVSALTAKDEADVVAARKAYDELNADQKDLVSRLATLKAAEAQIAKLNTVADLNAKIEALPAAADIKLENEDAVKAIRTAYDALTDAQKEEIKDLAKLQAAEAKIADLKEVEESNKQTAATAAVVKAENNKTQANVDAAQVLVTALKDGAVKTALQVRLDAVKDAITDPEVVTATYTETSSLGVAKVIITVENAAATDVEKVLINGSEVTIQRAENNEVTILSADTVTKVEIVVAGETYTVTK